MAREETISMFRAPILYREWGLRFTKIENYHMAIEAFEKSIEEAGSGSEDLRTLLGLCQALTNFTKYREAADVALKCNELDPKNFLVKWMWVVTLFKIAEFEHSLVNAYQGYKKTHTPFEFAIYQGNETIEDCVGNNTSKKALIELYPWIKELENHRKNLIEKLNEEEDEFKGIDEDHSRFKINDADYKLKIRLKKIDRALASRYLGTLASDKYFVEDILENPSLSSANKAGSTALRELTEGCITRSRYRQEVLRFRKPLYHFTFHRRALPETYKLNCRADRRIKQDNMVIDADMLIGRLHEARMNRDYAHFFRLADRTKEKLDSWKEKDFPMKKSCLNVLYEIIGWTYIDARNVTEISDEETKLRHLKHHLGLKISTSPSDTDLAWIPTLDKKKTLAILRRRLALGSEPLELAWLFHELSKSFMETKRYDLARFYAKKSRDSSYVARNDQWTLNAHHLMIRIEIHQHNRNEAREAAVLAFLGAKRLGILYLQDFYRRIVKLVNEIDLSMLMGIDSITAREQLITELMPEELKNEVNFLIQSMRTVPAKRRLSVMPGCKPLDHKFNFPCKRNTILPDPPKDPATEARKELLRQYAPSKKILGFIDFEDYE